MVTILPKYIVIIPFKLVSFCVAFFQKWYYQKLGHLSGKMSHPYLEPLVKAVAKSSGPCRRDVVISLTLMLTLVEIVTSCFGYHGRPPCFPASGAAHSQSVFCCHENYFCSWKSSCSVSVGYKPFLKGPCLLSRW